MNAVSPHSRLTRGTARAAILNATLRLVASRGIQGWTMRDVAQAAHCSLGSTTYHFADREQLVRAALEAFVADEILRLEAMLSSINRVPSDAAATANAVLREVDRSLIQSWTVVAQMELYLAATREPAVAALAGKILDSYYQFVEQAMTLLGVPATQAGARARLVVALVDGMVLHHLARGAHGEISDELARAVVALATNPL